MLTLSNTPSNSQRTHYDTSQILYEMVDCHQAGVSQSLQVSWTAQQILGASFSRDGADLHLYGADRALVLSGWGDVLDKPYLLTADGKNLNGDILRAFDDQTQFASLAVPNTQGVATIEELKGEAWITNAQGDRIPLSQGSVVYQGNVIETGSDAHVRIRFIDEAIVTLGSRAHFVVNDVYGTSSDVSTMLLSVLKGAFTFVSGLVARDDPETVRIFTPTAEIGIRGTKIVGEVDAEGGLKAVLVEGRIFVSTQDEVFDITIPLHGIDLSVGVARLLVFTSMDELVASFPAAFPDSLARAQFLKEQVFTQNFNAPELEFKAEVPTAQDVRVPADQAIALFLTETLALKEEEAAQDVGYSGVARYVVVNLPVIVAPQSDKTPYENNDQVFGTAVTTPRISHFAAPVFGTVVNTVYTADDVKITDVQVVTAPGSNNFQYHIAYTSPTETGAVAYSSLSSGNFFISLKKFVLQSLASSDENYQYALDNYHEGASDQFYAVKDIGAIQNVDFSALYRVLVFSDQFPLDGRIQNIFGSTPIEIAYTDNQNNNVIDVQNRQAVNDVNGQIDQYRAHIDAGKIIDHNNFKNLDYYYDLSSSQNREFHTNHLNLDIKVNVFNLTITLDHFSKDETISIYLDGDIEQYISQFYKENVDSSGKQYALGIVLENIDVSVSKVKVILYSNELQPYVQDDVDLPNNAQQIKDGTSAPMVIDEQDNPREAYITVSTSGTLIGSRANFLDFEIRADPT